ncbi:hypothetical protein VOLCADRAFT_108028 [Volvox carteri f. nagariensis]|uniref:PPM-type phosphatase domain-containing protein n=1 Tax=Volvox carteri f. nagariensis TaxID=3068 RepID=D8UHU7_VOLCA|nr:uncharacterized protein VOLCADRAFT_108028 [Volvox carteri f. nagariensis]EFJ40700.1 hypothetical protein VOLCADRAFT_108028 [Volvox carteri f. nagariensis]|eukprot:XP_002958246.1 hypothetical protein VOLCADRAFT_108028 [Volvox carteri f. nagariensis]
MSRQNQRYQSPFGAGRPSIFANTKLSGGRVTNDPNTPTTNSNVATAPGQPAGRPSAQTPSRTHGQLSPKLSATFNPITNNNTLARKNSGNGNHLAMNNTAPAGTLAGIARLVASAVGSNGTVSGGSAGLSVIGAATRGGPGGGLAATLPAGRASNGPLNGVAAASGTANASRPPTGNGLTAASRTASSVPGLAFSVGSNQSMGSRSYQEDYRAICDASSTPGLNNLPNMLLGVAVYDGHGGKQVSHWLASSYCLLNRAMEAVQQLISNGDSPTDVAAVLEDVFITCGNAAIASRMTAGSCVAMALLVQQAGVPWVLSANVGDSRTVIVSWDEHEAGGRPEAMQLSVDHKLGPAKTSEETRRVQAAGGTVIQLFGTWRIDGSLAVARAIGDSEFSRYVSCRPTVNCRQLMRRDRWLVIASDGLWYAAKLCEAKRSIKATAYWSIFDVLLVKGVVNLVCTVCNKSYSAKNPSAVCPDHYAKHQKDVASADVMTNDEVAMFCKAQQQLTAAKLSEALVREAVRNRGSGDNTTVIAVYLLHKSAGTAHALYLMAFLTRCAE